MNEYTSCFAPEVKETQAYTLYIGYCTVCIGAYAWLWPVAK